MGVLDPLFRKEREKWLDNCRSAAMRILHKKNYVTIEDVLKMVPRPKWVHRNATGSVFRTKDFKPAGWIPSGRPEMNGRYIRVWKIAK